MLEGGMALALLSRRLVRTPGWNVSTWCHSRQTAACLQKCTLRSWSRDVTTSTLRSSLAISTVGFHRIPYLVSGRVQYQDLHLWAKRAAFSSEADSKGSTSAPSRQTNTERIKVIFKEYGTVGFVFHITISLISVGTCYVLVSNGLNVEGVLQYFNVDSASSLSKGASTLAIAYVLHKVILPVRATITIVSVPIIVRWLRARGWMKGVAKQVR